MFPFRRFLRRFSARDFRPGFAQLRRWNYIPCCGKGNHSLHGLHRARDEEQVWYRGRFDVSIYDYSAYTKL